MLWMNENLKINGTRSVNRRLYFKPNILEISMHNECMRVSVHLETCRTCAIFTHQVTARKAMLMHLEDCAGAEIWIRRKCGDFSSLPPWVQHFHLHVSLRMQNISIRRIFCFNRVQDFFAIHSTQLREYII